MRVLHVEHRVVVAARDEQVEVEGERAVDGVADERVPRGVDADLVDEVLERDHVAGPLGQPDLLAALDHLDELTDEHLDVDVRVVAGARRDGAQPVDVAVVVGTEEVDADVVAAVALVDVVRRVAGEVRELAVAADEDPVLVVVEVRRAQPHRAVGLEHVAVLAQPREPPLDRAARVERALGVPDVEVRVEAVEDVPLLLELQGVAGLPEGGPPRRPGRARGWTGRPPRPGARGRRRRHRGSRPPAARSRAHGPRATCRTCPSAGHGR